MKDMSHMSIKEFVSEFISDYINDLSSQLSIIHPAYCLTSCQEQWLEFCLTGILLTNSINWSAYTRTSLGAYSIAAQSWMFRKSGIDFNKLLSMSIFHILSVYGITTGALLIDDTDNKRSKNAAKIHGLGKQKDKSSGGYFLGQSITFLVLVTAQVTIAVGFKFYVQDPNWQAWKREDKRLRKKGVVKKYRPSEVTRDIETYPTKTQLSIDLVKEFKDLSKDWNFKVEVVMADCFYGSKKWVEGICEIYPDTQIISQLKGNQMIYHKDKWIDLKTYFETQRVPIFSQTIVRGGKQSTIYYSCMIAKVKAHGQKRLIVAYKYEGEPNYRYLFAKDMSWRAQEVIAAYSLRWLVEVFIEDWKLYEGWAQMTKHTGEEGASSTLILSLLFDHCLLLHPQQKARIKDKLPVATVGSLRDRAQNEWLIQFVRWVIQQPEPKEGLKQLEKQVEKIYTLRDSSKHLSSRHIQIFDRKLNRKAA